MGNGQFRRCTHASSPPIFRSVPFRSDSIPFTHQTAQHHTARGELCRKPRYQHHPHPQLPVGHHWFADGDSHLFLWPYLLHRSCSAPYFQDDMPHERSPHTNAYDNDCRSHHRPCMQSLLHPSLLRQSPPPECHHPGDRSPSSDICNIEEKVK